VITIGHGLGLLKFRLISIFFLFFFFLKYDSKRSRELPSSSVIRLIILINNWTWEILSKVLPSSKKKIIHIFRAVLTCNHLYLPWNHNLNFHDNMLKINCYSTFENVWLNIFSYSRLIIIGGIIWNISFINTSSLFMQNGRYYDYFKIGFFKIFLKSFNESGIMRSIKISIIYIFDIHIMTFIEVPYFTAAWLFPRLLW